VKLLLRKNMEVNFNISKQLIVLQKYLNTINLYGMHRIKYGDVIYGKY
jgi:hypothetical protein